jgi:ABC-type transporter Mla MlaB component
MGAPLPPPGPRTVVLMVDAPITASSVSALCGRLDEILQGTEVELVACDVGALTRLDAGVVDAIARLQLTARRLGRSIRLRHASSELRQLLDLCGLRDAVPCGEPDVR